MIIKIEILNGCNSKADCLHFENVIQKLYHYRNLVDSITLIAVQCQDISEREKPLL